MRQDVPITEFMDASEIGPTQLRVIGLCALVALLDGFDTQMIAFVAPVIADQWNVDVANFGAVFGAGLLGLMLGALSLGPVADRFGRKRVIVAATLLFGFFTALTTTSASLTELIVYRFITGIGLGGVMPNIIALTAEYAPLRRRSTLVTLMFCGFPLGAVIGGLVSAQLIPTFGWQSVFYVGGALPLLLVPVLMVALPESVRFLATRAGSGRQLRAIIRGLDRSGSFGADPVLTVDEPLASGSSPITALFTRGRAFGTVLLWVAFFMNLLVLYFLVNWLPAVLQRAGIPIERAVIGAALLYAGGIFGGLGLGWLVDRFGPFRLLPIAYAIAACLVAVIGQLEIGSAPHLMPVIFLAGVFVIGTQFCMNALATNFYPTEIRATGVGWALGIGRIGSILGPVIGGTVLALGWSIGQIFAAAALPAVVAALAVLLLDFRWARKV